MRAKQYLRKAKRIESFIKAKEEELLTLKAKTSSIGCVDVSIDRVQTSPVRDKLGDDVAAVDECEREILKAIDDLKKLHLEITEKINAISNDDYRLILTLRYLNNKKWGSIAKEMSYSEAWIYYLHDKALNAFEEKHKEFLQKNRV